MRTKNVRNKKYEENTSRDVYGKSKRPVDMVFYQHSPNHLKGKYLIDFNNYAKRHSLLLNL